MPEKSGMVLGVPLTAGPAAGAAVCPKAGVRLAAANATTNRKPCRPRLMISSLRGSPSQCCYVPAGLHLTILEIRFVSLRDRKQVLVEMVLVVFRADHLHQRVRHLAPAPHHVE